MDYMVEACLNWLPLYSCCKPEMNRAKAKKLFSVIFLTIFFCKMVISIAPFIVAHFDSKSVNAAIMQLEIENHGKTLDVKESQVKEYLSVTTHSQFVTHPVLLFDSSSGNNDLAKHLQPFYPPVPTPPPNSSKVS